jgi:integrase
MAAFTKRKNKDGSTTHRAVIVRKGYPRMSHTGTSRHAVELWAASEESKIIGGTAPKIIRDQRTVSALFDEYAVKITAKKRGNTSPEISRLGQYKQLKWASKLVGDVTERDAISFLEHIRTRPNAVTGQLLADSTVFLEWSTMCAIFNKAVMWRWIAVSPFKAVVEDAPKKGKPRTQGWTNDAIDAMLTALKYKRGTTPTTNRDYVACAILLAIDTAMRRGEVLHLTCEMVDLKSRVIRLPAEITKTNESRVIPLKPSAMELLGMMMKTTDVGLLFPVNVNSFMREFVQARRKAQIGDVHFHDARREATGRFVHELEVPVMTLAKITGHKTLGILLNTYYQPDMTKVAEDFARRTFTKPKPQKPAALTLVKGKR